MILDEKPHHPALTVVSKTFPGMGFSLTDEMVRGIIDEFGLELKHGAGDMTGEKSAVFSCNGIVMRLKKTFTNKWLLYNGEWKSDPRWTGD